MRGAGRRLRGKARALWFEWEGLAEPGAVSAMLIAAALLDFGVGDPWGWPHPVQLMGKAIALYSKVALKKPKPPWIMKLLGVGLTVLVVGGTGLLSWLILGVCAQISPILAWICEVILLASCFAGRSLRQAAEAVLEPLEAGELEPARAQLAMYVGRDTNHLSEAEIRRAVLETVSENAVDGVSAPLFYAILGAFLGLAAPIALAYKAASTLDSMVGYREAPYTHLGWFSARFEDGLTWVPCRISVLAIALLSGRPRHVLRLCQRDAPADPSPNAGWSECAYAAALGVRLGGENTYGGQVKMKPYLGEDEGPITGRAIAQACRLTRWSFLLGLSLGIIGLWL